jgi:uncharacterized membrane protein
MKLDKIVTITLTILIVAAVCATIYIVVNPAPNEKFTEFYILGENGTAGDYPINMTAGQTGNVTAGIVNHESADTSYKLVITSNNNTVFEENVTLKNNEPVQIPYTFKATKSGELKFLLYKLPDENNVYRSLNIPVNVS